MKLLDVQSNSCTLAMVKCILQTAHTMIAPLKSADVNSCLDSLCSAAAEEGVRFVRLPGTLNGRTLHGYVRMLAQTLCGMVTVEKAWIALVVEVQQDHLLLEFLSRL